MEDTRDSGIGLKGTFEFTPGLYGETSPCWAAHYCGIRDEHEIGSYAEVLKYKRIEGDSAYASGCGHLKQADAQPRRSMALNRGPCSLLKAARPARSSRSSDTSICVSALSALCAN